MRPQFKAEPVDSFLGLAIGAHKAAYNFGFRLHANHPVNFLAGPQNQQCRNALDPEALGSDRVVVNIHSCELKLPGHFTGKLIENRRDRAARTAPGRPHVQ
jgi:hypothetical protein